MIKERPPHGDTMSRPDDLLKELRIDRSTPPPAPPRWGRWIAIGLGVAVVALSSWMVFGRARAEDVQRNRAGTGATHPSSICCSRTARGKRLVPPAIAPE